MESVLHQIAPQRTQTARSDTTGEAESRNRNDFLSPLIYLNTKENLTLSLGLRYFASTALNFGDNVEPRDHLLMAASLMAAAPAIALFFIAQRYFVRGIVMTGLKG